MMAWIRAVNWHGSARSAILARRSLADPWRQISQVRSAVSHRLRSAQPIKHTLCFMFRTRPVCCKVSLQSLRFY